MIVDLIDFKKTSGLTRLCSQNSSTHQMKIGYPEKLTIIVVGILLIFTGLWGLSSRQGLYVFGVIVLIVVVLAGLTFVNRNKKYEVTLLPNEKVLNEEEGVKVNIRYFNKSEFAPDCKVTLTNLRIVVGKRILFGTQYRDSFYFYFTEHHDEPPTPIVSLRGVSYLISFKEITVKSRKDRRFIYLEPQSHPTGMKYIELNVGEVDRFTEMQK